MIPIPNDSSFYTPDCSPESTGTINHRASIAGLPSGSSMTVGSPDEKATFDDFLSRVDSSLATIKKDVKRTSEQSQ